MNGPPRTSGETLEARVTRLEQVVVLQAGVIRRFAGDELGLPDAVALRDVAKGFPIGVQLPPARRDGR